MDISKTNEVEKNNCGEILRPILQMGYEDHLSKEFSLQMGFEDYISQEFDTFLRKVIGQVVEGIPLLNIR